MLTTIKKQQPIIALRVYTVHNQVFETGKDHESLGAFQWQPMPVKVLE